jgi:hypothetical protein
VESRAGLSQENHLELHRRARPRADREIGERESLYSNRKIREVLGFKEEHPWKKNVGAT